MPNNEKCRKCGCVDSAIVSAPPPHHWQKIYASCGAWRQWISKAQGAALQRDTLGETQPVETQDNKVCLWLEVRSGCRVTDGEIKNLLNRSGLSAGNLLQMCQTSAIANGGQFGFVSALLRITQN